MRQLQQLGLLAVVLAGLMACTPTVQLAVPNEPININLNVKIEHEIYIKVDKALDNILDESSGLF
ncbi:YnbE family lipoprotein [Thiopseudomonas alkaliphila]|uniref:YnbE family lipoprotein n=1 Tax=Thiopseudomonas alkaliphila TaxID=1697053 RepID=UPI002575B672|nr:YnbE family lipoprotein [Thiopseudomonas alkaliphila]MDM1707262.1 YnbE family lipoprotein [Thiopseudomonas alkaliphila]